MIEVEQLTKAYGEHEALRGVSFAIPAGQVCGYLGPNGAGKSTTIKILTGVMAPTSGRAKVAGFDVLREPIEVKRRIGYVPEMGNCYRTLSVAEYLTLVGALHQMAPVEIDRRTRRMLELFEIADAAHNRIDTLSKGMRQKVVLSAALLHDPDVLLWDEPLSGLDANAARIVKDTVRRLADNGKTVFYCSHVLDVVERICDRVIILHRGELVADGTPAQLMGQANRASLELVFRALTSSEDQSDVARQLVETVSQRDTAAASPSPAAAGKPNGKPRKKRRK